MRFTLFKIPVYIHPTFWIFLFIYGSYFIDFSVTHALIASAIVFTSLLVHEFGHAMTAKFFGAKPFVTLEAFGGFASYSNKILTPTQHLIITINGPLLQSSLILFSYLLLKGNYFHDPMVLFSLLLTFKLNIIWCLLNLLPIFPLDGGQIAAYFLEKYWSVKGVRWSIYLSVLTVAIAAPYLYMQGFQFFSIFLALLGVQNFQRLSFTPRKALNKHPFAQLNKGLEALNNNEIKQAKVLLSSLLRCSDQHIRSSAIESLAEAFLKENNPKNAYHLLLKGDHSQLKKGKVLLCKLAYKEKNHALITKYSQDIYAIEPTFENAALNAKAFARENNPKYAAGWLKTASGFSPIEKTAIHELINSEDFDQVRQDPLFVADVKDLLP